jgi:hypothetical protein
MAKYSTPVKASPWDEDLLDEEVCYWIHLYVIFI